MGIVADKRKGKHMKCASDEMVHKRKFLSEILRCYRTVGYFLWQLALCKLGSRTEMKEQQGRIHMLPFQLPKQNGSTVPGP